MRTLETLLVEHPFFKGLDPQYLNVITGCASNAKFEAGEYLFREGQNANAFYVIRKGKVGIETYTPKGPVLIQTISDGEILGWSWLVSPYRWRFDAKACDLTRVISLDGACLRKKCEEDHHLGYELLKRFTQIITDRLEATRLQLLDVYGNEP